MVVAEEDNNGKEETKTMKEEETGGVNPKAVAAEEKDGKPPECSSMVAVVGGPVCDTKGESGHHIRITPGFEDGYCDVCCEKKAVRLVLEFVNGKLKRKAGVCEACSNSSQKSSEDLIKEYGKEPELKEEKEKDAEARKDPSR